MALVIIRQPPPPASGIIAGDPSCSPMMSTILALSTLMNDMPMTYAL